MTLHEYVIEELRDIVEKMNDNNMTFSAVIERVLMGAETNDVAGSATGS